MECFGASDYRRELASEMTFEGGGKRTTFTFKASYPHCRACESVGSDRFERDAPLRRKRLMAWFGVALVLAVAATALWSLSGPGGARVIAALLGLSAFVAGAFGLAGQRRADVDPVRVAAMWDRHVVLHFTSRDYGEAFARANGGDLLRATEAVRDQRAGAAE